MSSPTPISISYTYITELKKFRLEVRHRPSGQFISVIMEPHEAIGLYNLVLEETRKCAQNPAALPAPLRIIHGGPDGGQKEKEAAEHGQTAPADPGSPSVTVDDDLPAGLVLVHGAQGSDSEH